MKLYFKTKAGYQMAGVKEISSAYVKATVIRKGSAFTTPRATEHFLKARLSHLEHEVFCVMFLDNRHFLIAFEQMFRGTIDGTSVYPREVVKDALRHNAAAVILAHNHPSGDPNPSESDERITSRIKTALELVDIRLLDHIVVGKDKCISLAERGKI